MFFFPSRQPYDGGNVTLSQLTVQLTPEDDGKKLVCRVENSALGPASAVEDSWLLDVYCKLKFLFCFPYFSCRSIEKKCAHCRRETKQAARERLLSIETPNFGTYGSTRDR